MALSDQNDNGNDVASIGAALESSDAVRRLDLSADEKRLLAEKLYAMLLADVRLTNSRRQEPLPRR